MSVVHVGCDPGMDGAIAILVDGSPVRIIDMPTITLKRRSKGKTRELRSVDHYGVAIVMDSALLYCDPHSTPIVAVEKVMGRQGEASASSFRFGACFSALYMHAISSGWVVANPRPQEWKPAVGLPIGSTKDDSREYARTIWPDAAGYFKRKRDHGRADACLIARYRWLQTIETEQAA